MAYDIILCYIKYVSLHIYVYIYIYIYTNICIYIYIYIHTQGAVGRAPEQGDPRACLQGRDSPGSRRHMCLFYTSCCFIRVCVCTRHHIYIYIYNICVYVYIYIYMYIYIYCRIRVMCLSYPGIGQPLCVCLMQATPIPYVLP